MFNRNPRTRARLGVGGAAAVAIATTGLLSLAGAGSASAAQQTSSAHKSGAVKASKPAHQAGGNWFAAARGAVFSFGAVATPDLRSPLSSATPAPLPNKGPDHLVQRPKAASTSPGSSHASSPGSSHASSHATATPVTDYPAGSVGYDVSQYQCSTMPGQHTSIGIVQVSGGSIDSSPNPCYVQQAKWAGPNVESYIYMDGLPSSALASQSFNYGYTMARHWVDYSRGVGVNAHMWWLDVENNSGWNGTTTGNGQVIQGALAGLKSEKVKAGVYSSPGQWQQITGNMAIPGVPTWSPGAGNLSGPGYTATNFCAAPSQHTFGGGKLKLVQYGYNGSFTGAYGGPMVYDYDYACP